MEEYLWSGRFCFSVIVIGNGRNIGGKTVITFKDDDWLIELAGGIGVVIGKGDIADDNFTFFIETEAGDVTLGGFKIIKGLLGGFEGVSFESVLADGIVVEFGGDDLLVLFFGAADNEPNISFVGAAAETGIDAFGAFGGRAGSLIGILAEGFAVKINADEISFGEGEGLNKIWAFDFEKIGFTEDGEIFGERFGSIKEAGNGILGGLGRGGIGNKRGRIGGEIEASGESSGDDIHFENRGNVGVDEVVDSFGKLDRFGFKTKGTGFFLGEVDGGQGGGGFGHVVNGKGNGEFGQATGGSFNGVV